MRVSLVVFLLLLGFSACAQKSMIEDGSYQRANSANDRAQAGLGKE
jgi:hypothetical protein